MRGALKSPHCALVWFRAFKLSQRTLPASTAFIATELLLANLDAVLHERAVKI